MRQGFQELPQELAQMLKESPAEVGVAVRRLDGSPLFLYNEQQPFPLASVAKIYLLVAYLDHLEKEHRSPDANEIEMLQSIIEVSDNVAAQEIWTSLGGIDGMQRFLGGAALRSLDPASPQLGGADADPEAWGDAAQTAAEMSLLLGRLREGKLLNAANTRLANDLLGQVIEEHTWGASAGIDERDPGAKILFKNGWYPADEGWRINTAGIVLPSDGTEPYVVVIFGQHFLSYASGVRTVESIATTINRIMLE